MKKRINSINELSQFAFEFVKKLKPGKNIVALQGDLGAGKTTFAQMVGNLLGVIETMQSPTFVIFKIYKTSHSFVKHLCHIDLYRLKKTNSLVGFEEYLDEDSTLCLIEWPEKIKNKLPKKTIWLKITVNKNGSRTIEQK